MIRDEQGQATVETLFSLMVLISLFFGGFALATGVSTKEALDRGTYEGARYLALTDDKPGAVQKVKDAMSHAVLGGDPNNITVTTSWTTTTDYGDQFYVEASYPITITLPLVGSVNRTLTVRHYVTEEKYP